MRAAAPRALAPSESSATAKEAHHTVEIANRLCRIMMENGERSVLANCTAEYFWSEMAVRRSSPTLRATPTAAPNSESSLPKATQEGRPPIRKTSDGQTRDRSLHTECQDAKACSDSCRCRPPHS